MHVIINQLASTIFWITVFKFFVLLKFHGKSHPMPLETFHFFNSIYFRLEFFEELSIFGYPDYCGPTHATGLRAVNFFFRWSHFLHVGMTRGKMKGPRSASFGKNIISRHVSWRSWCGDPPVTVPLSLVRIPHGHAHVSVMSRWTPTMDDGLGGSLIYATGETAVTLPSTLCFPSMLSSPSPLSIVYISPLTRKSLQENRKRVVLESRDLHRSFFHGLPISILVGKKIKREY